MANYLLTQTGEEVQGILNQAPETEAGLQQEVTNREQAITAEQQAREQAIAAEATAREQAIAAEATARADADDALDTKIDAETTRAEGAEGTLDDKIDQEVTDRTAAVAAEATARQQADTAQQQALAQETSRAQQTELANAQAISTNAQALQAEANTRQNADTVLQDHIDDEEERAKAAEATLQANIDAVGQTGGAAVAAERERAEAAESTLDGKIDAETDRAEDAEQALTDAIAKEVTDRTAAVSAEATARQQADTAEATARADADAALQTAINGKQDTIADLATIRSGAAAGSTAYQKPATGIPATDMSADVQTSLDKADSALQEHQSLADYYTKSEVDSLITTPDQEYVSVTATAQTTAVTDVLPATGAADTIYRVGNWDGTQYDPTMYALFAWNGTTYVCLAVRSFVGEVYDISVNHPGGQGNPTPYADLTAALGTDGANIPDDLRKGGMSVKFVQSSDNKYVQYRLMADEWSTDTTDWSFCGDDTLIDNPEYVRVYTDKDDRILWAIKTDGSIYYGAGVPPQIIEYINNKIAELSLNKYEDIVVFLGDLIEGDKTLRQLLDEKLDAEGLDANALSIMSVIENPEWANVTTDKKGRIVEAIGKDGTKYFFTKIVGIDNQIQETINALFANKPTLDKFSEQDGSLLWNNSPIEGGGVTLKELNQRLSDYSTTEISDERYAAKSVETTVSSQSSQILNINNSITSMEGNLDTIRQGLSDLTSPLPSGAIAGDNVWTGSNQFMQAITGVSGTDDNNVALYGQFKNTLHKFEDAADYGFDVSKTGAENALALNAALQGGNKTVIISKPGIYLIGDTILIEDNTTLICGSGVIFKKASTDFCSVILNKGAATRTFNENISLIGVHILHNNKNSLNPIESPLYGMRGVVGFICVKHLFIDNLTIPDLAVNAQYAVHINSFEHITVCNSYIAGEKDGIHLSDGKYFAIRNCQIDTSDDVVAMNSSDWDASNCVDGSLNYGLIECCSFNYRGRMLMLVGAFVDWFDGMEIVRGDRVVSNGKVYRAVGIDATRDNNRYYSHTQPTISTYNGVQEDSGGFSWKLVKEETFYQTNVENITIRDCYSHNTPISARTDVPLEGQILYNRSIYPTVPHTDYPKVSCSVKDCVFDSECFNIYRDINVDFAFENVKLGDRPLIITSTANSDVRTKVIFRDCDYSGLVNNVYHVASGYRTHIVIDGAKGTEYIKFFESNPKGRVESNYPCDISLFTDQKKGDVVKGADGTTKIYNGSTWNNLTN